MNTGLCPDSSVLLKFVSTPVLGHNGCCTRHALYQLIQTRRKPAQNDEGLMAPGPEMAVNFLKSGSKHPEIAI